MDHTPRGRDAPLAAAAWGPAGSPCGGDCPTVTVPHPSCIVTVAESGCSRVHGPVSRRADRRAPMRRRDPPNRARHVGRNAVA